MPTTRGVPGLCWCPDSSAASHLFLHLFIQQIFIGALGQAPGGLGKTAVTKTETIPCFMGLAVLGSNSKQDSFTQYHETPVKQATTICQWTAYSLMSPLTEVCKWHCPGGAAKAISGSVSARSEKQSLADLCAALPPGHCGKSG